MQDVGGQLVCLHCLRQLKGIGPNNKHGSELCRANNIKLFFTVFNHFPVLINVQENMDEDLEIRGSVVVKPGSQLHPPCASASGSLKRNNYTFVGRMPNIVVVLDFRL